MERLSNGPHWVLLRRVPSEDKTFSRLKKNADYRYWNKRSKHPFSNKIKWKESNGPHWVLLRRVPLGDKTLSRFWKGGLPPLKRNIQTPLLKHNKMERIKWTPFGSASHPSRDKTFSRFQQGGLPLSKRKVQTPFLKHNKMERLQMDPISFRFRRVNSGDKKISRFQKAVIPLLKRCYQSMFQEHKMERLSSGTHTGSDSQTSLGG